MNMKLKFPHILKTHKFDQTQARKFKITKLKLGDKRLYRLNFLKSIFIE